MPELPHRRSRDDAHGSGVSKLDNGRRGSTTFKAVSEELRQAPVRKLSTGRRPAVQTITSTSASEAPARDGSWSVDEGPNASRVKGITFITSLDAIAKCYGQSARERLERVAPGEMGDALRFGGIVAAGWYKIGWYKQLWSVIGQEFGLDDAGVRRLAQKATAVGVNVVYRTLFKLTSPAMLLSAGERIFSYYFDRGSLRVTQSTPGHIVVEWSDCVGFDRYVWNHVIGGATYYLEAAGARAIEITTLGGGGDADWLRMNVKFIEP